MKECESKHTINKKNGVFEVELDGLETKLSASFVIKNH